MDDHQNASGGIVPPRYVATSNEAWADMQERIDAGTQLVYALYHAGADWVATAPRGVLSALVRAQRAYRVNPPRAMDDLIDRPARPLVPERPLGQASGWPQTDDEWRAALGLPEGAPLPASPATALSMRVFPPRDHSVEQTGPGDPI